MTESSTRQAKSLPSQGQLRSSSSCCRGEEERLLLALQCTVTLKEKMKEVILFPHRTIHFKYPFYYIICIVILTIDLADSSNEAGEYKGSNNVNCCL